MKKIILSLSVIILFSCSSKQKDNSLKQWNLKGPVESVRNQSYDAKLEYGDEIIKTGRSYNDNYQAKFDEAGFLTERIAYESDEDIREKELFTYKDSKLFLRKSYDADGEIRDIETYYYNNGALAKITIENETGDIQKTIEVKANKNNLTLEGVELNEKGVKNGSWKNEISGDRITKHTSYDSSGAVRADISYTWNSKNDLEKINYKSPDFSFVEKRKYKYDDKGNWIHAEVFNENDSIKRIEERFIQYYGAGNKVSTAQLIGIWEEEDGDNWIEFQESGKYHWGADEDIEDTGKYEYNKKQSTISFISNKDNSKKFRVEFTEGKLTFKPINGSEEKVFIKK